MVVSVPDISHVCPKGLSRLKGIETIIAVEKKTELTHKSPKGLSRLKGIET